MISNLFEILRQPYVYHFTHKGEENVCDHFLIVLFFCIIYRVKRGLDTIFLHLVSCFPLYIFITENMDSVTVMCISVFWEDFLM